MSYKKINWGIGYKARGLHGQIAFWLTRILKSTLDLCVIALKIEKEEFVRINIKSRNNALLVVTLVRVLSFPDDFRSG